MDLFRHPLADLCRQSFPHAASLDPSVSPTPGGRTAGLATLRRANFARYAATRNHLTGHVTRLSSYLRHGCLSLAEVRDEALSRHKPLEIQKLLSELAWQDYYQRLLHHLGPRIHHDLEAYKTGLSPDDYADELPSDIPAGQTGLACIDAFARELAETGYMHNHARMWTAAYVVHFRRVKWQAGARWFFSHLLDGDEASNTLSWQWVASTFSHKPYFFNRENLQRYTDNHHCPTCPARNRCPFAGEYDTLAERLFPSSTPSPAPLSPARTISLRVLADPPPSTVPPNSDAVVWAHEDALSADHPAYRTRLPALITHDTPHYTAAAYTLKRIVFIAESADELLRFSPTFAQATGDPETLLPAFARQHHTTRILIPRTPSTRIRHIAAQLARTHEIEWIDSPPFVHLPRATDLTRFSRYWRYAEPNLLNPRG